MEAPAWTEEQWGLLHTHMFDDWVFDILFANLLYWNWYEKMHGDCYDWMLMWYNVNCGKNAQVGWDPRLRIEYSRLYSVNKMIDMDINMLIYYFDRVAPNRTFRGDSVRFDSEFLFDFNAMVLMCVSWFACHPRSSMLGLCAFIHAYRKSYLRLKTPRVDPGRLNRI